RTSAPRPLPPPSARSAADTAPCRPHTSPCSNRFRDGTLDALDLALAEDAVRPDHQHHDHQQVRCEVLRPAADQRIEVSGSEIFDHADDEAADDRTDDRV